MDDDLWYAETAAGIAQEAGLVTTIIEGSHGAFSVANQLLEEVQGTECSAVICDHRLSHAGFASFTGAEFVSRLYQEHIPAVLLSTFSAIDDDTSIRLYRARIPSLVNRSHLGPDQIISGLERCENELDGHITPERTPWRTLVRVEQISRESEVPVVDAIVHTWDPNLAIRFPLDLIEDPSIRKALLENYTRPIRLFAMVNVGCQDGSELYFRDFEWAPEPNIDDLAT